MTIEKWLKEEKMRLGRFKIYCVNAQNEEAKSLPLKMTRSCWSGQYRTWDESVRRKTLGSGLKAGSIGAKIDIIKPALPAQTHAPIAIHFAFGVSRTVPLSPCEECGV